MNIKILQISDLHFGPYFDRRLADQILVLLAKQGPNAVIISGDLTQRAKAQQFRDFEQFLTQLKIHCPVLVIPGNHDIPLYRVWERCLKPYGKYYHYVSKELHQTLIIADKAVLVGINTTHPWRRITDSYLAPSELSYAAAQFSKYHELPQKILVVHQDPYAFPNKTDFAKFTAWLDANQVNMLLSGHSHTSFVSTMNVTHHQLIRLGCGTSTSTRRRGSEIDRNTCMLIDFNATKFTVTRLSFLNPSYHELSETIYQSHHHSPGTDV